MDRLELTREEVVSHILGLPLDRVSYLIQEHNMPLEEEAFCKWFVANAELVLREKIAHFNKIMRVPEEQPLEVTSAVSLDA